MAIVYSLLVMGQGELLLLPLQLTTPGFTEYFQLCLGGGQLPIIN